MKKISVFRNENGGCDFYRAWLPINTAMKNGAWNMKEIWASNLLFEISNNTDRFLEVMNSDIYLIQRLAGEKLIKRIRSFAAECKLSPKIIIDHDDDVFNVSPLSNHYWEYGTKEIKIVHDGKIIHEWKDGVNIDIKKNIKVLDEVKTTLGHADMVTVTTDILADVFRQYNDNVKVLQNCLDLNQWNRLDVKRKNPDEVRICWAGGHSHWEDLYLIREPLREIGEKYQNVKIIMVGYMPQGMKKHFREGQIEFHEWVETPAHPFRMAALDIDIALIPLAETPFNRSKSAIKWMEFGALEIPSVTSFVPPYSEIKSDEYLNNGIFIDGNDKNGWIKGLELLIENHELRKQLGKNAREFVKNNFDINTQYNQWVKAYEEVQCPSSSHLTRTS